MSIFSETSLDTLESRVKILWYLKGTYYKINYTTGSELGDFSDSNWAVDVDTRRSTTRYCFILASKAISWMSKLVLLVCGRPPSTMSSMLHR